MKFTVKLPKIKKGFDATIEVGQNLYHIRNNYSAIKLIDFIEIVDDKNKKIAELSGLFFIKPKAKDIASLGIYMVNYTKVKKVIEDLKI